MKNNKIIKKYSNIYLPNIRLIHNSCVLYMETIKNTDIENVNYINKNGNKLNSVMEIFSKEVVSKLYNIYKHEEILETVFTNIDYYMFITSLSLSELLSDKSESKNVIASTNFLHCPVSEEELIKQLIWNLSNKTYNNDLYIIIVSWLNTIDLNIEIKSQEFVFTNMYNNERKLIIRNMGYPTLLKYNII